MKRVKALLASANVVTIVATLLMAGQVGSAARLEPSSSGQLDFDLISESSDAQSGSSRGLRSISAESSFAHEAIKGLKPIGGGNLGDTLGTVTLPNSPTAIPSGTPVYPPWYDPEASSKCNSSFEFSLELEDLVDSARASLGPCLQSLDQLTEQTDSFAESTRTARDQFLSHSTSINSVILKAKRTVSGLVPQLSKLETYYPKEYTLVQLVLSSIRRAILRLTDTQIELKIASQQVFGLMEAADGLAQTMIEVDASSRTLEQSVSLVDESVEGAMKCSKTTGVCSSTDFVDDWNREVLVSATPLFEFVTSCPGSVERYRTALKNVQNRLDSVPPEQTKDALMALSSALEPLLQVAEHVIRAVEEHFNDIACCFLPLTAHKLPRRLKTILGIESCQLKSKISALDKSVFRFSTAVKRTFDRFSPEMSLLLPLKSEVELGSIYPAQNISVSETCSFQALNISDETIDLFGGVRNAIQKLRFTSAVMTAAEDASASIQAACNDARDGSKVLNDCCAHFRKLQNGMECSSSASATVARCTQCESGKSKPAAPGKGRVCGCMQDKEECELGVSCQGCCNGNSNWGLGSSRVTRCGKCLPDSTPCRGEDCSLCCSGFSENGRCTCLKANSMCSGSRCKGCCSGSFKKVGVFGTSFYMCT